MLNKSFTGGRCEQGCPKCAPPRIIEIWGDSIEVDVHNCIIDNCDVAKTVKTSFCKLILRTHPDKGGTHDDCIIIKSFEKNY